MDHTNRIHAKWNMNDMNKNNQRSRIDKTKLPEHPKRIFTRLSWKKSMRNIAILPFGNICSQARADNWKTITIFFVMLSFLLVRVGRQHLTRNIEECQSKWYGCVCVCERAVLIFSLCNDSYSIQSIVQLHVSLQLL